MFKLNLILRRKSEDIMTYSPAFWFRIIFLILFGVLVWGVIAVVADESDAERLFVPIIVGMVCLVAALYEESWTFDSGKRIITSRFGLVFLHRKRVYSFAEIQNFELMFFLRGAKSDGKADHEINLSRPFSAENMAEVSQRGPKIIHKRWHQELRLNFKSGNRDTLEALDSRTTEGLQNKAGILADFCGIPLVKND
ncbi:MAG: hypothetical protein JEZ04_14770 [Spirochaetales bacterium]|nr:hypothetical protein [Spirochaetales bacterium]